MTTAGVPSLRVVTRSGLAIWAAVAVAPGTAQLFMDGQVIGTGEAASVASYVAQNAEQARRIVAIEQSPRAALLERQYQLGVINDHMITASEISACGLRDDTWLSKIRAKLTSESNSPRMLELKAKLSSDELLAEKGYIKYRWEQKRLFDLGNGTYCQLAATAPFLKTFDLYATGRLPRLP